ncbi:hypothetical protein DSL72_001135 [Monilinia vaccinii-corymbosi]|uniref:Uncharacterized protein n=1 Tax=Monilinia vaccinii-corymbosi TaxID=61207 RepID=A0A8A3P923_9HELO|nr:hypothetical protein DSL72_001135 [Monilinia vaccinii-corymbosi]
MVHTVCYDHVQHTSKQIDNKPCPKNRSGIYKKRTSNKECLFKNGQVLEGGHIFRHGSTHICDFWEFDCDPNDPKLRLQRYQHMNDAAAHQRSDSMDRSASAGEDKMDIEADDGKHRERGRTLEDWQERTKKYREPRFKAAEDANKEQSAAGRRTVNRIFETLTSDDEDLTDEYRTAPESAKIKTENDDTTIWSPTPSRFFSDPTALANMDTKTRKDPKHVIFRGDRGASRPGFLGGNIYRPPPPRAERFFLNTPAPRARTYMTGISHSRYGSGSTYTGDADINRGSPEPKSKRKKAIKYDTYRPNYPTSPPDFNTSFYAGDAAHAHDQPQSKSKIKAENIAGYNPVADVVGYEGPSGLAVLASISAASRYMGYSPPHVESKRVFEDYNVTESYERAKKARVEREESEDRGEHAEKVMRMSREDGNVRMEEAKKEVAADPMDIAGDVEMEE